MVSSSDRKARINNTDATRLIQKMKSARHGTISTTHILLAETDPDFAALYEELFELLMTKERVLNVKTKELIVIGILASKGAFEALRMHIVRAFSVGLTEKEILESLEVSMMYGGTESLILGGQILINVLDERKKAVKSK